MFGKVFPSSSVDVLRMKSEAKPRSFYQRRDGGGESADGSVRFQGMLKSAGLGEILHGD